MKNGAITRNSRRFLKRPPRNAIVYAIGKPMRNVSAVAIPPYARELPNWRGKRLRAVSYARVVNVSLKPSTTDPLDTDVRNIWMDGTTKKMSSQRMPGARRRYGAARPRRRRRPWARAGAMAALTVGTRAAR